MRDIRPDIQERIDSLRAKRSDLRGQLAELDRQEETLKMLMVEENARWEKVQPTLFVTPHHGATADADRAGQTPLARFLVDVLKDRKPHPLPDLVERAKLASLDFGAKNPGRSIHFALIGLAQNKWVRRLDNGFWVWVEEEKAVA